MPRVLIISLRAGEGHVKAAQALEEAFNFKYPFTTVKRVDVFDYSSKLLKNLYGDLYLLVAKKTPRLHNYLYETLNLIKDQKAKYGRIIFDAMNSRPLLEFIEDFDPDVVIATHPVPAGVLEMFVASDKGRKKIPLVVVITDYELHQLWINEYAIFYIVASEEVKKELENNGVAGDKILPLGIPLRLGFTKVISKEEARLKLGLNNLFTPPPEGHKHERMVGGFTAFILAGAFGSSPAQTILDSLSKVKSPFQTIVVAGRNQELFSAIKARQKHYSFPLHLFGFTEKISDLMFASDVLISKPGGLTVTESIAAKLPMLIIKGFAGQEEANARYLLSHQCAVKAKSLAEIPSLLEKFITDTPFLHSLKKNLSQIARPNAALEAAELIWKKL